MAYREVSVFGIREVLRYWLGGDGFRAITGKTGVDRKTVRRYVKAAEEVGLVRDAGEGQLTDLLVGQVCLLVRPGRPSGHGAAWEALVPEQPAIKAWIDKDGLNLVKVHELLSRRGVDVPYRTLHRFAVAECGFGRRQPTVRVADGEPAGELQVDFGSMGYLVDSMSGKRRLVWALIFTACYSRHCFVWLTHQQTTAAVIGGFEAAWRFFNGVFKVVIPDNMKPIIDKANPLEPRLNDAFLDYAQARGFAVDAARVRKPTDKPKVERTVPFVRGSFWKGETFASLADAQRRAEEWCRVRAGLRVHGTTQRHPAEVFAAEEAPLLASAPEKDYDLPTYPKPKVHRDHHVEVDKALYSVPGSLIGQRVSVRADSKLVKIFHRGALVKTHVRAEPGGRRTDPDDLPSEKTTYAMRDVESLKRRAAAMGPSVGAYAAALLDTPLPWTSMRRVYALLGLSKRYGNDHLDDACRRALEAETVNVRLVTRMLERAAEAAGDVPPAPAGKVLPGRFARDDDHFAVPEDARPPEATNVPLPGITPVEETR